MEISFGHAWHWIAGGGVPGLLALEEGLRAIFRVRRKKDNAKAKEALEKGGAGAGVGLMDFQVAEQWGWDAKRARSALKRLQKSGDAHESEGRWYLGGVVQGRPSRWARRR